MMSLVRSSSRRNSELRSSHVLFLATNTKHGQGVGTCDNIAVLSDPTETPPYRETSVAIPLSHCVSSGIADYRCYTPTSFLKNGLSQPKTDLTRGVSQKKLASEAYRAIGGVARNSIANRAIVGDAPEQFKSRYV